jgi:hypothetical protein
MSRPKAAFDDLRSLTFRDPEDVLDPDEMYTIYEVGRLLQGVDPDRELDVETENVLLDWAIPWMMNHSDRFVFAEPDTDADPGYYGLAPDVADDARDADGGSDGADDESGSAASDA